VPSGIVIVPEQSAMAMMAVFTSGTLQGQGTERKVVRAEEREQVSLSQAIKTEQFSLSQVIKTEGKGANVI